MARRQSQLLCTSESKHVRKVICGPVEVFMPVKNQRRRRRIEALVDPTERATHAEVELSRLRGKAYLRRQEHIGPECPPVRRLPSGASHCYRYSTWTSVLFLFSYNSGNVQRKTAYDSIPNAESAAQALELDKGERVDVYKCITGNHWHLTTRGAIPIGIHGKR